MHEFHKKKISSLKGKTKQNKNIELCHSSLQNIISIFKIHFNFELMNNNSRV